MDIVVAILVHNKKMIVKKGVKYPAKIYGSKWVGDMGESPMDQNLSLDCGGALCHTFFMVSSVSRESV